MKRKEQFKINYKLASLAVNPRLKAKKIPGTAYYHIVEGLTSLTNKKDTASQAWKECYNKIFWRKVY